ncbi:prevent-host-death family protein [Haemophilus paracuniculus]|uniref:Antitoxin n=1 Tax=Haemophilus paracuniculus TaxID=734 RepID=A0A1T0ASQ1_9PAST|nr:YoeB-YefM toxin-antitoxin system antitoxin YefM [Haemophilus paracuniculus]OOR99561.1 prevent-host-death family protein [Haemophilus paracuniculus]
METITYSEARQNLAQTMLRTTQNQEPIMITRQNGQNCVLISLEHYRSLEETAYLLRSPKNAQRLIESIRQLNANQGQTRELIE